MLETNKAAPLDKPASSGTASNTHQHNTKNNLVNQSTKAQDLNNKGYSLVAIAPGKKVPVDKGWTGLTNDEVLNNWHPDYGIGLRCGDNGLIGVDIDVYNPEMVIKLLQMITLSIGKVTTRTGQEPKVLVPLSCSEITGKMVSNRYLDPSTGEVNAIEILSAGQQFVVHGIHPDTNLLYVFSEELPHRSDLPEITLEFVTALFTLFDRLAIEAGWELINPPKRKETGEDRKPTSDEYHYNNIMSITDVLTKYGWKPYKKDMWTRPGKNSGSSGTVTENTFYCFTSSTVLEPDMTHRPYDIVLAYEYNGDTEAMAKHVSEVISQHAAKSFGELPPLPPGAHTTPAIAVQTDEQWESPISIDTPALPTVTKDMLPAVLSDIVFAISDSTETPPELATALCLATCATSCQKKYVVQSALGHKEQLSLWAIAALESGNRKSSVEKIAAGPLRAWEKERYVSLEPIIKETSTKRDMEMGLIKSRKKDLTKCLPDALEDKKAEILGLEQALTEVPKPPQVWGQDITPEHLGTVMNDNNESLGLFSSEGGIFDIIGGRYSGGVPNLDIFLQSHSGDPVRVNRGSRDPVNMSSPALSMGLSPQPSVLRSMADSPGFRGRGLVARFMYFLPPSPLGNRKLGNRPQIPPQIYQAYSDVITRLLNLPYPEHTPTVIQMSPEASELWHAFSMEVEQDLGNGGKYEYIKDWAGKLPGLIARIAGVYNCVQRDGTTISMKTMDMALKLSKVIIPHALATFDLMGADDGMSGARIILNWVTRNNLSEFTGRDCFEATKGTFKKVSVMDVSLKVLEEHFIIRERSRERRTGRPSRRYDVNPLYKA